MWSRRLKYNHQSDSILQCFQIKGALTSLMNMASSNRLDALPLCTLLAHHLLHYREIQT